MEEGGAPKSLPWCSLLILGHQFWGDLWSPEVCYGWNGGSMPGMCQATGLRACWGHGLRLRTWGAVLGAALGPWRLCDRAVVVLQGEHVHLLVRL